MILNLFAFIGALYSLYCLITAICWCIRTWDKISTRVENAESRIHCIYRDVSLLLGKKCDEVKNGSN